MTKQKINIPLVLTLFIITFFAFSFNALAAGKMTSVIPEKNYNNGYYIKGIPAQKNLSSLFIFIADHDGNNPTQAYCIQPGLSMATWKKDSKNVRSLKNYQTLVSYNILEDGQISKKGYTYGKSYKKDILEEALNYSYQFSPKNIKDFNSLADAALNISNSDYQKVIASQAIVWEIVTGERTSFNSYSPDNALSNGFYQNIINKNIYPEIKKEYYRIIDAAYYSYHYTPGNNGMIFKPASPVKISAKIGETFTIKDNKNAFKYFKVSSVSDGLKAEISKDGSNISITATKAISESTPGTVKISVKDVKENAHVYHCTQGSLDSWYTERQDCQDFAYGGKSIELSINVYTKKYEIGIKKVDEDGNPLAGAKFNICKDSKCNNVLNKEPLVSGANGMVVYSDIEEPGTYYAKEIEAPEGYEIDSTSKKVTVNGNSTATITMTNKARIFDLTKRTIDEFGSVIDLDDGCGTDKYTGPVFKLYDENKKPVYFEKIIDGIYKQSTEDNGNADLKTCNGRFSVKLLTSCKYTIIEEVAPEGLTLPSNSTRSINVCSSDKNISFTNGFTGLEFQKKNENGEFISGGKFALQRKENNVYKDVLLREEEEGQYTYDASISESDPQATYILLTNEGISTIAKIAPGEYRIVEKEAPEGYEAIEDKDSAAKIIIKDGEQNDYYLVELINKKVNISGDEASAELIVTITTGRKILNYVLIFSSLIVILVGLIIIRKKMKK